MRKFLATIILLGAVTSTLSAQIIKVGLRGAMTRNTYTFQQVELAGDRIATAPDNDYGYEVGILLRLSVPKFLHLQPELNYASRNYNFYIASALLPVTSRVKLNTKSVELPITMGYNVGPIRIFSGPVFRLRSMQSATPECCDISIDFINSDIALLIGAGFDIGKCFFDARFLSCSKPTRARLNYCGEESIYMVKTDETWSFGAGFFF